jgi:hypothetical protein
VLRNAPATVRRDRDPQWPGQFELGEPLMISVHHLNESRFQRILWLLEEFQLPYEI